jgi:hypothetical protein
LEELLTLAEDFEVSIFLTEMNSRHSLLTKQKHFYDPAKKGIQSNSSKLTGNTNDNAIEVEEEPVIMREDSEEDGLNLQDVPAVEDTDSNVGSLFVSDGEDEGPRRSKRRRTTTVGSEDGSESSSGDKLPLKRRKDAETLTGNENLEEETNGKKKLALNTTYDGFSIYGRVLCLIVKRKDKKAKDPTIVGGQAMMEDWITSTQIPEEAD